MPSNYVPCYCRKDRGRLVSKKTFRRHNAPPLDALPNSALPSTAPLASTSREGNSISEGQHGGRSNTRKRPLSESGPPALPATPEKRARELSPTQSDESENAADASSQNRSVDGSSKDILQEGVGLDVEMGDSMRMLGSVQDGTLGLGIRGASLSPVPAPSPIPPVSSPDDDSARSAGDGQGDSSGVEKDAAGSRSESDEEYGPTMEELMAQEEIARQAARFRELEEQRQRELAAQNAARQAAMDDAAASQQDQPPPVMDPALDEYLAGYPASRIERLNLSRQFIEAIQSATLENGNLSLEDIERIRSPPEHLSEGIEDDDVQYSLDLYLSMSPKASDAAYNAARDVNYRHPSPRKILSLHSVKKLLVELTGITAIRDDMCPDSCAAYTGPYAELHTCPLCTTNRYCPNPNSRKKKKVPKVPQQQMVTIPLGPQLQALRRSKQGSKAMSYRARMLSSLVEQEDEDGNLPLYEDILSGKDIREFAAKAGMTGDDITVGLSFDGAQLYRNKQSDTWIAVWIVYDYHPTLRYKRKHILPALIVPGPKKPKNIDSFMFRSLHHLSALQRENNGKGIRAWDYTKRSLIWSRIFFLLAMADAIALCELDGRAGHHAARGCRLGCPFHGRYREGSGGHYFSAHLCPNDSTTHSNHPDFNFRAPMENLYASKEVYDADLKSVLASTSQTQYENRRKATGISRPSLVSGLLPAQTLPPPKCFSVDLMHLLYLNVADLMISLFRGEMRCEPTDQKASWPWMVLIGDIWTMFGKVVEESGQYYPSHFHRPPRNPCEKISSGYKATEFYKVLIDLMPAYLYGLLDEKYWRNFCRLVHGVRILVQRKITYEQAVEAYQHLVLFVEEFEYLYYQRRLDRMHFCRPCLHTLIHASPEIFRVGPGVYGNQFPMERIIGQFGGELRQPGTPFANLMEIAIRRSQSNAVKVMYPQLDHDPDTTKLPKFAEDVGNGYVFLRPRQYKLSAWKETDDSIREMIEQEVNMVRVAKWGRMRLPNGQICRSYYCESNRKRKHQRVSRNVLVTIDGREDYGEVQFFFYTQSLEPKAIISLYDPRNEELYEHSRNTVSACEFERYSDLHIVDVTAIKAVISMQPMPPWAPEELSDHWFVVEKSGLEDVEITGWQEPLVGGDQDDYEEADAS